MRVLLFDLDGTLIDSTKAILESFRVVFEKFNKIYPTDDEVKKLIGLPLDVMFYNLGIKDNIWDYVNEYKKHYRKISKEKTLLLPRAKEAIYLASAFARLGIVTTKTALYSKELLKYFGVMDYFEVLIGRENVTNPKPHPEPILKAIHLMKAHKESTWMIGDTCLDMVSAKEAGVNYIGVKFDYENEENLKKCVKIVKKDVYEAVKYIKENETVEG